MSYEPTWQERVEDAKRYLGPAVAAVIVLGVAGWVVWHQWGRGTATAPRSAQSAGASGPTARAAAMQEVAVLEQTYERALAAGAAESDLARLLDRTILRLRTAMQLAPTADPADATRLAQWETARGTIRARVAATRSRELEAAAAGAVADGRIGEALEKLRDALRLQREANANTPSPELKDVPRESRLAAAIDDAEAGPWQARIEVARTLATAAVARESWAEALKAYQEARDAQTELNRRFPASRLADAAAVGRFDAEIASLTSARLAASATAREREAEAAAAAGRTAEATAGFTAATDLQREINLRFPRSRHASATRIDELAVRRDTALSAAAWRRVEELERAVDGLLARQRPAEAGPMLAEAVALVERTTSAFPRSRSSDPARQLKFEYLAARRGELDALQRRVQGMLVRVPGSGTARLLRSEVPQALYQQVMNANPSRHAGPALPVDSVSWDEAGEFCRRLGWVLAAKVRLPTEAEFRAAWGEGAKSRWSAETAGGCSHEAVPSAANGAGFVDLAGNVAEWLHAPEAGAEAPVAGGSYLDGAEELRRLPVRPVEKRDRARHIGFRIVVE